MKEIPAPHPKMIIRKHRKKMVRLFTLTSLVVWPSDRPSVGLSAYESRRFAVRISRKADRCFLTGKKSVVTQKEEKRDHKLRKIEAKTYAYI